MHMDAMNLKKLEKLNQLRLEDDEREDILAFYKKAGEDMGIFDSVSLEDVRRMVHVMPMVNVIREDISSQPFTRDELQAGAPEASDGYWQVPRLVE